MFTAQEFSRVGSYTENPIKPQNCQNWRVSACSGQYGNRITCWLVHIFPWQQLGSTYPIVPGKRPWALATQARKIEGGRLHGEGA